VVTAIIGMAFSTLLCAAFQFLLSRVQLFDNIIADHYYLIAQLFATLLTLVVNYLMHKFWIYRR
jgi:putative flippase GtrA